MKISSDVRKHWRTVCTSNTQTDSGVSMRGINKILDDVEELEREIERLKAQATIAKLQWTEIAPDNLPLDRDYLLYRKFQGSDVFSVGYFSPKSGWWLIDGEIMRGNSGYTHFCPISPPAQDSATEKL